MMSITKPTPSRHAPRRGTRPQRKNPPYARAAAARLAAWSDPRSVDLRIFTGHRAWKEACWWNSHSTVKPILALPPGDDPAAYRWEIVRGTEPWLIETGNTPNSLLQRLALELLSAGAPVVRLSFWDNSNRPMAVFKESPRG
jgi:hypothetical protein